MSSKCKKAKGTGTIRHKTVIRNGKEYSYWEGRVTVGQDPLTGKQIQKSVTAQTQAEVIKKMHAIQVDVESQSYLEPSKMTVAEWLDIWLKEYCANVKPGTIAARESLIRRHIKPSIGNIKISSINAVQIQKMYNSLKGIDGEELTPIYKRNIHAVLHNALQTAVKVGIIKENPASNTVRLRNNKKQIRVLTDEEILKFLDEIKGNRFECVLTFALFTGLRRGEICGLSWDEVDFESGTITIKHQIQREHCQYGEFVIAPTKNSKSRIIKPASYIMELLRKRKLEQYKARLEAGEKWNNEFNLVFTLDSGETPGRYILPATLFNEMKRIFKHIGIPEMRLHDLRHTYAVTSLRNGDDIKIIQENLGHSSAAFTLETYIHVTNDMRDKSSERMEDYIEKIKSIS